MKKRAVVLSFLVVVGVVSATIINGLAGLISGMNTVEAILFIALIIFLSTIIVILSVFLFIALSGLVASFWSEVLFPAKQECPITPRPAAITPM